MQLYLQFGFGMMEHAHELIGDWGGGGVILSPRDLEAEQLKKIGSKLAKRGAEVLLDPQCFVRDADHHRLTAHRYWQIYKAQSTVDLSAENGIRELLTALSALNEESGAGRVILPGLLADVVSEEWLSLHSQFATEGASMFGEERVLATVALSQEAVRSEDQVEAVIDHVALWPCGGVYLVCETPGAYLVEDPIWLANLLILTSGLRLAGKTVVVGYCHHQMLVLGSAKVDAIASGTWLNVRAFPPDKFYNPEEDEMSRRTTWYYCPQALSEYKLQFLDIALRNGVLEEMRPDQSLGSTYADALFRGAAPSTISWGEQSAFRHYLTVLHGQCAQSCDTSSFENTLAIHNSQLSAAEALLKRLRKAGVFGQDRDFTDCIDVSRAALLTFEKARGARLRHSW